MIASLRFALVAGLCLTPVGNSCAQFVFKPRATVVVQYYPDRVAAPYDFEVWCTSIIDHDHITIEAPDGTIFSPGPSFGSFSQELHNLTATDLNRFAGLWTINDFQGLQGGVAPQKHTFIVNPATLTRFPPRPRIISPTDGAILPPMFKIKNSSGGFSLLTPEDKGSLELVTYSPPVERTYRYLFNPGVTEAEIEARAASQDISIGDADAPQQANRIFSVWRINDIYSPPSTFTVRVPEPATVATGCFSLVALAALRRRK